MTDFYVPFHIQPYFCTNKTKRLHSVMGLQNQTSFQAVHLLLHDLSTALEIDRLSHSFNRRSYNIGGDSLAIPPQS